MKKNELEDLIVQKLWEISDLYAEASGQKKFRLSICVCDDMVFCFNDYWDNNQEYPLDILSTKEEE